MTYTAPQPRGNAQRPPPEAEAAPSPHEIKYRHDAAHYVSSMLTELRQIAEKAGFDKVVKAIDAAYYEAYGALGAQIKPAAAPHNGSQENISDAMEQTGQ